MLDDQAHHKTDPLCDPETASVDMDNGSLALLTMPETSWKRVVEKGRLYIQIK